MAEYTPEKVYNLVNQGIRSYDSLTPKGRALYDQYIAKSPGPRLSAYDINKIQANPEAIAPPPPSLLPTPSAQKPGPDLSNYDPEFMAKHPTFAKAVTGLATVGNAFDQSPVGKVLGRVGQRAAEAKTGAPAAEAPDVGKLNIPADILGFGASFIGPRGAPGVTGQAAQLAGAAGKALRLPGKVLPTVARGGIMGGGIGLGEAAGEKMGIGETVKTVGTEAALWGGLELGGLAVGAAGKAIWAKVPQATKDAMLSRLGRQKVAEVVEEAAKSPEPEKAIAAMVKPVEPPPLLPVVEPKPIEVPRVAAVKPVVPEVKPPLALTPKPAPAAKAKPVQPVESTPAGGKAKEPWEMSREEYVAQQKREFDEGIKKRPSMGKYAKPETWDYFAQNQAKELHNMKVVGALNEGKPVPPEVLKDYPKLAGRVAPAKAVDAAGKVKPAVPPAEGELIARDIVYDPTLTDVKTEWRVRKLADTERASRPGSETHVLERKIAKLKNNVEEPANWIELEKGRTSEELIRKIEDSAAYKPQNAIDPRLKKLIDIRGEREVLKKELDQLNNSITIKNGKSQLGQEYQNKYTQELKARKLYSKAEKGTVPEEIIREIQEKVGSEYKTALAKNQKRISEIEKRLTQLEKEPLGSAVSSALRQNAAEVADVLKETKKPALGLSVQAVPGTGYTPSGSPVEQAFQAGKKELVPVTTKIKETFGKLFSDLEFEPTLRDFPRVKEYVRRTFEIPGNASRKSTQMMESIVAGLNKEEAEVLARKAVFTDWLETVKRGEKVTGDLTEQQIKAELVRLQQAVTPKIEAAYQRHLRLVKAVAEDLVNRGKLGAESVREAYYPHKVIQDYSQLLDDRLPGLPSKLKTPYRGYTQQRMGSQKAISTDYVNTLWNHFTKVEMDNMLDDSIENLAKVGEIYTKLPVKRLAELRKKLVPGQSHVENGVHLKAWQPSEGNYLYRAEKVATGKLLDDLAVAKNFPEMEAALAEHTREILAVGSRKPTYILPAEVADRLNNFRASDWEGQISRQLRGYVSWWRRIVTLLPGLRFDANNLFGDADNFFANLGFSGAKDAIVKAAKMLKTQDPQLEKLLSEGVFSSDIYTMGGGKMRSPILRSLADNGSKAAYYSPISWYERFRVNREATLRIGAYLLNSERAAKGLPLKNQWVDVEGLLPEEAVAKIGRETVVDYNALGRGTQKARGFTFPFITWYLENFRNWAKYVEKKPVQGLARIFLPMAALTVWNRTQYPEVEKELPDYLRENPHLITGIKNKEGGYYVVPIPLAGAIAASMLELQSVPDKVAKIITGESTLGQEAVKQAKQTALGPGDTAWKLVNPLMKTGAELLANKNTFTGAPIVPAREQGTKQGNEKMLQYGGGSLFPPYQRASGVLSPSPTAPKMGSAAWLAKSTIGAKVPNLEAEQRNRVYDTLDKVDAKHRGIKLTLEEAYIKSRVTGDEKVFAAALQQAKGQVTTAEVKNMLRSPRVQIAILNNQLRAETDPAKRTEITRQLNMWKDRQVRESVKAAPKAERGNLLPLLK